LSTNRQLATEMNGVKELNKTNKLSEDFEMASNQNFYSHDLGNEKPLAPTNSTMEDDTVSIISHRSHSSFSSEILQNSIYATRKMSNASDASSPKTAMLMQERLNEISKRVRSRKLKLSLEETYDKLQRIRKKVPTMMQNGKPCPPESERFRDWIDSMRKLDLKFRQLDIEVNAANLLDYDALEEDTGRHAWLDGDDFEDMFGYSMEIVSPKGMIGFE